MKRKKTAELKISISDILLLLILVQKKTVTVKFKISISGIRLLLILLFF